MDFGNQTLADAGAYQLTNGSGVNLTNVSDDATGSASGYNLSSSGVVTASSNGSLSAQDGNTIDVTSDQGSFTFTFNILSGLGGGNAYSVADIDELIEAMENTSLAYGDTIYCRGGDYNPTVSNQKTCLRTNAISGTVNGKDDLSASGLVVITPHTGETPKIWRLNIAGNNVAENGFHFYKITFRSPADVATLGVSEDAVSLQGYHVGGADPTDVKVTECFGGIEGGFTPGDDPYSFIEGFGARFHAEQNYCSGCYDFIKCKGTDCILRNNYCEGITNDAYKFSDCPNLLVEGEHCTNKTVRYGEHIITGVTRGTTTTVHITNNGDSRDTPTTGKGLSINGTGLSWLDGGYKKLGGSSSLPELLSVTSTSFTVDVDSTSEPDWVSGGVCRQGRGSHGDYVQVLGGANDGDRDNMTFRGCVFTHGEGVADFTDGQGIYFQNPSGACLIRNLLIDGVVCDSNTGNGILINRTLSCTVRNSVFVNNQTGDLSTGTKILIGAEVDFTNIDIENTITNGYSNTPNITNSTMNLDQTSIVDYRAMFEGPIPDIGSEEEYDGWVIYQTKTGGPGDQTPQQGISNFDRTGLGYTGSVPEPPSGGTGRPFMIGGLPLIGSNGLILVAS